MKKFILLSVLLLLAGVVFAVKVADLPEVMRPTLIRVDGSNLFISDEYVIFIYSLNPVKLKAKLGKQGEGPGEFKNRPIISVSPGDILVTAGEYLIWYSKDGRMIKDKRLAKIFYHPLPLNENYLAYRIRFNAQTREITKIICVLNSQFEELKELYSQVMDVNIIASTDTPTTKFKLVHHIIRAWSHDGKVFIADTKNGFFIKVFDSQGNYLYTIDKNQEIEKAKLGDAYKKWVLDYFRIVEREIWKSKNPSSFVFYEYAPPIKDFFLDSNKIYVTTYKEKDNNHEIIILDLKGNILDRIFVPLPSMRPHKNSEIFDPYFVHRDVLYELVENQETETWELHTTDFSKK